MLVDGIGKTEASIRMAVVFECSLVFFTEVEDFFDG